MTFHKLMLGAALLAALAGCGGGGDSAPEKAKSDPPSVNVPVFADPQAAYVPSTRTGLVFLQNGKQVAVTDGAVPILHVKTGPLKMLIPKGKPYQILYVSLTKDKLYQYGNPIEIGGNVFAMEVQMPVEGWHLYGTSIASLSGFDFNQFLPSNLPVEGAYRALPTDGFDGWSPLKPYLLVYFASTASFQTAVPAEGQVEVFQLSFD